MDSDGQHPIPIDWRERYRVLLEQHDRDRWTLYQLEGRPLVRLSNAVHRVYTRAFPPVSGRGKLLLWPRVMLGMLLYKGPGALIQRLKIEMVARLGNKPYEAPPEVSPIPKAGYQPPRVQGDPDIRVLYVVRAEPLLSKRYRVYNMVEQLALHGIAAEVVHTLGPGDYALLHSFDVLVFARESMTPDYAALIAQIRENGGPALAYDLDDLLFDPYTLADQVSLTASMTPLERREYIAHVRQYRALITACDHFIGTTEILADTARHLGLTACVIRNSLNQRQVELAEEVWGHRDQVKPNDGLFRIGYLSGTPTHDRDFAVVAPALVHILGEYSHARLVIRGHLDLPRKLKPLRDRIEFAPFVHWEDLMVETAKLDLVIVPLEPDNPFTEAKSELKYFEAAVVGVPVIATPTGPYRRAAMEGEYALLADNTGEWVSAMRSVIRDDEPIRDMVRRALADDRYHPAVCSLHTAEVFRSIAGRGEG